ncbi:hypothetical protein SLE2022_319090 [Rubroshorea leprosula]
MRVKIANDRQRKSSSSKKVPGALKVSGSTSIMNRMVQPGQSYAQAVKGQGKRADKASEQSQEKEKKKPRKRKLSKQVHKRIGMQKNQRRLLNSSQRVMS